MAKKNKLWRYALTVLTIIIFIILIIIIIPFVIFNDLVFGTYKGWNYNFKIFAKTFEIIYFFAGIKSKILFPYVHNSNKKYVFVANHISYFDIPELLIGIKQPIRVLAKKGPEKIPLFGYYYRKSTVIVDRSSPESRISSIARLKKVLDKGISIMVFPEGTFNMTNEPLIPFYDGAFKLAIETQTNIKPLIMLDTFNTLHYSGVGIQNGQSRIVYLQEINVQGLTLDDVQTLKDNVSKIMEKAIIDYKAPWVKDV